MNAMDTFYQYIVFIITINEYTSHRFLKIRYSDLSSLSFDGTHALKLRI